MRRSPSLLPRFLPALALAASALPADAEITLYTSESEWQAAAAATLSFDTTAANVGLAVEAAGPPGPGTVFEGGVLTFPRADTGLCHGFAIAVLQPGWPIVFDDADPGFDDALSIGGSHPETWDDDAFAVVFSEGAPVHAFGAYLTHDAEDDQYLYVDVTTAQETSYGWEAFLPSGESTFVGFVSDSPLEELRFAEYAWLFAELAVKDLRFDAAAASDRDGDGIDACTESVVHGTDPANSDTDDDGLSDGAEVNTHGTSPLNHDTDGDGSTDGDEALVHGSDPNDADSDDDGLLDGFEVRHGLNPLAPGEASQDPDGDGVNNLAEQTADIDPHRADTDGDGLGDGAELQVHGTDPARIDTDGDGLHDGFELSHAFDPLLPGETQQDPDGDGMRNLAEQQRGTDPRDPDSDDDDFPDGAETSRVMALGFGAATRFAPLGSDTPSAVAADLDHDGDLDVAALRVGKLVWHANRLGEPSSDFGPENLLVHVSFQYSAGTQISAADLDGDGDPDLLRPWYSSDEVVWHENRLDEASADFAAATVISGDANGSRSAVAADLDGDGDQDVIGAADLAGEVTWYENRLSEPSAAIGPGRVLEPNVPAWTVVTADLDRDGDADILQSEGVSWFENRYDEATRDFAYHAIAPGSGVSRRAIFPADVDGDGDTDVVGSTSCHATWHENRLAEPSVDFGPELAVSTDEASCGAGSIGALAAADFDGDGDLEVVAAFTSGTVAWYENRLGAPSADFGEVRVAATVTGEVPWWLEARDLDGDGDPDLLSSAGWQENLGTNPNDPDSDDDGLSDGYEVAHGLDPLPEPEGVWPLGAGIALLLALRRRAR